MLDTRKTTPTLRALEKYAVRAGGGNNHRLALDDGILIKDNHVRLAGGVAEALRRMREAGHDMPIEIEVQSLAQLDEALAAGATRIMADNFDEAGLAEVVRRTRGRAQVEVSGGVTLDRLAAIAASGADFVSDRRAHALGAGRRHQLRDRGVMSFEDERRLTSITDHEPTHRRPKTEDRRPTTDDP